MSKLVSECHKADMTVVGGAEGTNHYECTECGQSCNFTAPEETLDQILSDMQGYIDDDEIQAKVKKEALDRINKLMDEVIGPDISKHNDKCFRGDNWCICGTEDVNRKLAEQRQRLAKLFKGDK